MWNARLFSLGLMLEPSLPTWLHWLETVSSTNSWAIERGAQLRHGDVVFTPCQTAGRGQFDRSWQSPPGVLTASFILDGFAPDRQVGFSLAAGLSAIYSIEDLWPALGSQLQLKWPNDLWYQQRKLAGILCEAKGPRLIVGIGCNLQADFSTIDPAQINNPISLHQIDPQLADCRLELLAKLRQYLLEAAFLVQNKGLAPLLPELQRRDGLQGRFLQMELPHGTIAGRGAGIDSLGRLQIALPETPGAVIACATGRVML
jgi:BirA family transcriptional regulator, biotin operon repressor / biotin---[acetyl-CoA-carboxylase] ligase